MRFGMGVRWGNEKATHLLAETVARLAKFFCEDTSEDNYTLCLRYFNPRLKISILNAHGIVGFRWCTYRELIAQVQGPSNTVLTGMTAGRASKAQGYSDPASEAPEPIKTEHEADRLRTVIWCAVDTCGYLGYSIAWPIKACSSLGWISIRLQGITTSFPVSLIVG